MQRYFAKEKITDEFILSEKDLHHIKNVMRGKINDNLEVVYENKVYLCKITQLTPLKLTILNTYSEDRESNINLTIAVSLVSEQKFDLILQKLTELGVNQIIPVKTERSIVKIDDKKIDKKYLRWQTICKEASEQSHRLTIPKVQEILTIKELCQQDNQLKILCSLNNNTKPLATYLTNKLNDILFFVGPEGGFTPKEEEYLLNNNFKPVTLGKRVLRVETATFYVASIINYIYKGWYYEFYYWFLQRTRYPKHDNLLGSNYCYYLTINFFYPSY